MNWDAIDLLRIVVGGDIEVEAGVVYLSAIVEVNPESCGWIKTACGIFFGLKTIEASSNCSRYDVLVHVSDL